MEGSYLTLPLQFDGAKFKTNSLQQSVATLVSTVISTPQGSVICDGKFGTAQLSPEKAQVEIGTIKEDLAKNIKAAIEQNESRLSKIAVKIHGGMKNEKAGLTPLKIEVVAELGDTGKKFRLEKTLTEDYYRAPFPGRVG
jgi:predicted component of type VI protein secretion system